MKRGILWLMMAGAGMALVQVPVRGQAPQPGESSAQPVRPIGVVTQLQADSLTLRTDAGPELRVPLPEGITVVRVPPGAKSLQSAVPIAVSEISVGDRVLIRGRVSNDQKSVLANSIIVMAKTDLEKAREAERLEWQRRGIGGLVRAVDPEKKAVTISVPNTPPTPGNPTHPLVITLAANAVLFRYAPDSVKFSDAKPSSFDEIRVGDQVRALGTKSEDGSHFTAERLVSGTFRSIGATVISVDEAQRSVTVKDLASGQPLLVRTNGDSKLHRLPPYLAQMIAAFNSVGTPEGGAPGPPPANAPGGGPPASRMPPQAEAGGPRGGPGERPHGFQQMLERTPTFSLADLKPGEPVIVVSTEGAKPSEVTAIALLAGVEPILAARPKGSKDVELGPWSMGGGGGGGEEGGAGGGQGP
jgi:hypothetical protein